MSEITEAGKWERTSAHSHITGLGLDGLKAKKKADGLVGQEKAREAAALVVRMIKAGKFAGNTILLAGPPGSGKTAIATGIAKELGSDAPFVPIAASEIYSAEVAKTEFLTQALRKAIGVRIHDFRNIYEGKVEELNIEQEANPYNPYQKIPVAASIKLATKNESKKLRMDAKFAQNLIQQNITTGDIIQIDADGGRIAKAGISEEELAKSKMDLTSVKTVDIPSGPIMKEKEFIYTLTLHNLDEANSRSGMSMVDLFFGGRERKEISQEIRQAVDAQVKDGVESGKMELLPGVLFIDECSMLDMETFAFLNRAMEHELAPIIIFATNRGVTTVRGADVKSPHGMPLDLLDRLLIINTREYGADDVREIIRVRAKAEKIKLSDDTLKKLVEVGVNSSLRYAVRILGPAAEIMSDECKTTLERAHVERADNLFADLKESVGYLKEVEKKMLYEE